MVNQLPPGFTHSKFKHSDVPVFQLTLHSLLSLFAQRVSENPCEIRSFRTLSKNNRVYPNNSQPGTRSIHQARITRLLRPGRAVSALSFACFAVSSPRLASHESPITSHESPVTGSHPPVPNRTDSHTLQHVYTPCAILPFLHSGDRPFLPPWRPS